MLPVVRSGLSAASQEIAVISNNIANASSLGFKRSNANFSDVYTEMSDVRNANRIGNGVRQESPRRNHSQGSLNLDRKRSRPWNEWPGNVYSEYRRKTG